MLVAFALAAGGCGPVDAGRNASAGPLTDTTREPTVRLSEPERSADATPDQTHTATRPRARAADRVDGHEAITCSRETATVETITYKTVAGVPADQLSLDLYRPNGCEPRALLIWVHGGGWTGGDKLDATTARKAAWAQRNGWSFASVNYRLTGSGGARWPDHGDDVTDAVVTILENAAELGIDAERVALLGHSAGGHIVTHIVSGPHRQRLTIEATQGDPIDCVVSLDGVGYRLEDNPMVSRRTVTAVFGDTPEDLDAGSPQHQIDQWGPPAADVLVVARGSVANRRLGRDFHDGIVNRGGRAHLLDVSPYDHGAAASMLGAENESTLTGPVTAFLYSCLRPASENVDPSALARR